MSTNSFTQYLCCSKPCRQNNTKPTFLSFQKRYVMLCNCFICCHIVNMTHTLHKLSYSSFKSFTSFGTPGKSPKSRYEFFGQFTYLLASSFWLPLKPFLFRPFRFLLLTLEFLNGFRPCSRTKAQECAADSFPHRPKPGENRQNLNFQSSPSDFHLDLLHDTLKFLLFLLSKSFVLSLLNIPAFLSISLTFLSQPGRSL